MNHKSLLMLLFVIECMVMEKGFSVQCGACKSTIGWKDCYVQQKVKNCTKTEVCMKVRRTAHYHKNTSQILYFIGCMPKRDCNIDFCHRPLDSTERKKFVNVSCDQLECRREHPISLAVQVDRSEASDVPLQCGSCRSHVSWDDCSTKLKLRNCNKTDVCMKVKRTVLYGTNDTFQSLYFIGCMPKRYCTIKSCRTHIDDTERKLLKAVSCEQLACWTGKEASPVPKDPSTLAVVDRSEESDLRLHGLLSTLVALGVVSARQA